MVGLERLVVHHGMRLERIAETAQRTMHHVFMKQPLEKRSADEVDEETNAGPD